MSSNPSFPLTDANGFYSYGDGSNLRKGTNPPYAVSDFTTFYPQFGVNSDGLSIVPVAVIQTFIDEANARIQQARWHSQWQRGMRLYIAHYCTLWLKTSVSPDNGVGAVLNAGKAEGVITDKSVGDVHVSFDTNLSGRDQPFMPGAGDFHLTEYGRMYATLRKQFGLGGMHIY